MRYLLIILSLVFCQMGFAQNTAVSTNETLKFTAAYNMSGIMTDLAEVSMETGLVKTSKATLLRLRLTATTYSKWDSFFKIRDLYESYVSPTTLTPYLHKRDINEGGYYKFMQYKFQHKSKTIASTKKKRRGDGTIWEENKSLSVGSSTNDIVTSIYKIRNLNLDEAVKGKTFPMTIIFDNKEFKASVVYLGTETISTGIGKKLCHKLAISVNNSTVLKGSNDNLLWLTADANKIPVHAKFKIAVGNGELKIKSASGLKN
ncbi:DUF3108 domain-containing protein [Bizionia myxarmorum]|uniref:DUF3108 domain-containing protein n=1 Tax=Bizionia myxarmorum TaxID=291186 RepID=A0A5D0R0B9_9FLAO|nr:DUF3108 domain-containing protein [Bizionia myxarmorum]TYB74316.1 DUF3108 domain-containing protein [Bizionia myxarmorum]